MVINILLYADDVVLLTKTKAELQKMINIVENFGIDIEIKFNPLKTNYIAINSHTKKIKLLIAKDNTILHINGAKIDEVNTMKYLGNYVSSNLKMIT